MSPNYVDFYWDPQNGGEMTLMNKLKPYQTTGIASFTGHRFYLTVANSQEKLIRFDVVSGQNNYYYDPINVPMSEERTLENLQKLSTEEYVKYEIMKRNQKFSEKYKEFTGRDYLNMYPRPKPLHYMWRADYFGQTHWVTSKETHFKELPPNSKLRKINKSGVSRVLRDEQPRLLSRFRTDEPYLNMTLKVLSCAPRAFEIMNFLSDTEVDHIIHLANTLHLAESSTSTDSDVKTDKNTRSSRNTWVDRNTNPIIDSIYRRAADLVRIDEALLRDRDDNDIPWVNKGSIAEQLQLVHYNFAQQYTAHHDFGYDAIDSPHQSARFCTLLLYLNEGMSGGETEFPRWFNGETEEGLRIKPVKGKAVLFYDHLPDGNNDDLSQHAANPISGGEKYLINLWLWDPYKN